MNPVTAILVFVIVWWLVFLAALPFGVRGQWEDGNIVRGSDPGAPVRPMLLKKALISAAIAAVLSAILIAVFSLSLLDISDLPGPDSYWE